VLVFASAVLAALKLDNGVVVSDRTIKAVLVDTELVSTVLIVLGPEIEDKVEVEAKHSEVDELDDGWQMEEDCSETASSAAEYMTEEV